MIKSKQLTLPTIQVNKANIQTTIRLGPQASTIIREIIEHTQATTGITVSDSAVLRFMLENGFQAHAAKHGKTLPENFTCTT